MKKFIVPGILVVLFAGFALAAGEVIELPPVPELDFAAWAADVGVLAGVVIFLTAVIRKWVWNAEGAMVPLLSVLLGAALGAGLHFLNYFDSLGAGLFHGISAGVAAFGGVDALRGILKIGKNEPAAENDTRAAAARLRR